MLYKTQARWFSGESDTLRKEASLGIVWANAVNTRVMLSRTGRRRLLNSDDLSVIKRKRRLDNQDNSDEDDGEVEGLGRSINEHKPTLIRRMHLVFSPFAPPGTVDYVITSSGVHSMPDSYKLMGLTGFSKRRDKKAKLDHLADGEHETGDSQEGSSQVMPLTGNGDQELGDGIEDDFGGEVFDDLGDLPAQFWEGKFEVVNGEIGLAQGVGIT